MLALLHPPASVCTYVTYPTFDQASFPIIKLYAASSFFSRVHCNGHSACNRAVGDTTYIRSVENQKQVRDWDGNGERAQDVVHGSME